MSDRIPILEVHNLKTYFYVGGEVRKAVDGVSIDLAQGETLGIVGRSGSGKSVLARSILGLVREPGRIIDGEALFRGGNLLAMTESELERIRGREIALIVPNPRANLNPLVDVGSQIANVLRAKQSLSKRAALHGAVELLASVDIADPLRVAGMLPDELSGGMCQRAIIAMALANNPSLIVADEPTGGLDVTVQTQVLEIMSNLVSEHDAALLLMTRDLGIVAHFCQRVAVLKDGQIIENQLVNSFFENPRHPHSEFLLRAAFAARGEDEE